jgi:hypothetical protein
MPRRLLLVPALALLVAGCGSAGSGAPSASADAEQYAQMMDEACNITEAAFAALPEPTEATMPDFATQAAALIADEAERLRAIEPTDERADDHRAFVANTDRQAARWEEVAATSPTDSAELDRLLEAIGQLTLGRDELALEMGVEGCRRAG